MYKIIVVLSCIVLLPMLGYSQIYYSAGDSLWMASPGEDPVFLAETEMTAYHLTVDAGTGYIYWTLPGSSGTDIERYHPDNDEKELILELDYSARGIVIDSEAGKLYWTKLTNKGGIFRANLDGSDTELLIDGEQGGDPTNGILDLDIDPENEKIYWSRYGMIMSSNMEGTSIDTVSQFTSYLQPFGLSLNARDSKLYWVNTFPDAIVEVDLETGDHANLFSTLNADGVSVNLNENKIYWVEDSPSKSDEAIFRADLDGSNKELIVDIGFSRGAHYALGWDTATSLDELSSSSRIITEISLLQNYPNPFNPTTQIRYRIPQSADVQLTVFNMLGQKVATIVDGKLSAGWHTASFDASGLSSGAYIYRIQAGGFTSTKKLTLVK